MIKVSFLKKVLFIGVICGVTLTSFAQEAKTAGELKAEREQLQAELKSKGTKKREEKIVKLASETPKQTASQSVNGLVEMSKGILVTLVSNNEFLATFKREITDNGDGEIDVTTHKAKLTDYVGLAANLAAAGIQITSGMENLKGASDEVKSLSPLEAASAGKSVKFSSEALKLSGEEVALQLKLVNNLIATIKSSDNL
ncbi:MAG: hypothetical protein LBH61_04480 [Dysgonamonadaceae bacterium]|jgi:hypothetical protein|nr:hypothetical protein [Dysgonamonadaceae bacterium]